MWFEVVQLQAEPLQTDLEFFYSMEAMEEDKTYCCSLVNEYLFDVLNFGKMILEFL
jgi:hypothetical protein